MPYVQVDLDAMDGIDAAAPLIELPPAQVLGGLVRLWAWCWRNKTTETSAIQIHGFMGGGSVQTTDALCAFGFLEKAGVNAFRVRGAGRYLRLKEQATAAGKASAQKRAKAPAKPVKKQTDRQSTVNPPSTAVQPEPNGPSTSSNINHHSSIIRSKDSGPAAPEPVLARELQPAEIVYQAWRRELGKPDIPMGKEAWSIIGARLKEHCTVEQLCKVPIGARLDAQRWPERAAQDGIPILFGSNSAVAKYVDLAEKGAPRPKFNPNGGSPIQQLGVSENRGPIGERKFNLQATAPENHGPMGERKFNL